LPSLFLASHPNGLWRGCVQRLPCSLSRVCYYSTFLRYLLLRRDCSRPPRHSGLLPPLVLFLSLYQDQLARALRTPLLSQGGLSPILYFFSQVSAPFSSTTGVDSSTSVPRPLPPPSTYFLWFSYEETIQFKSFLSL